MQKDQSDQELNFKKRARRRLVGAIALVLLMVILLPMVLKDRVGTTPQEKVTITLPNETASVTATPSDFDSSVVSNENQNTVEPKPTESTTKEVATEPIDTEAPAKSTPAVESTATQTKTPPKEAPKEAKSTQKTESTHKFYVQIGVFSDAANVKKLQTKLTDLGYKSQTEKIKTDKGEKIRLKTQTFADRNEAAIALQNIKDGGLTGMVVSQ